MDIHEIFLLCFSALVTAFGSLGGFVIKGLAKDNAELKERVGKLEVANGEVKTDIKYIRHATDEIKTTLKDWRR